MSDMADAENAQIEEGPGRRRIDPAKRRIHCTMTVCAGTVDRLEELCERYSTQRGRLVDRLVETLYQASKQNKVLCVHGSQCALNRTDLPAVW